MEPVSPILHVDMDAFYASVEQHDNPALKGKPILVGASPEQRGVVAACSYEARRFGIHSAMPMGQALRLCPEAVVLSVRMRRYAAVSRQIRRIFVHYTPEVEVISIDEAFLDVGGCIGLFGHPDKIARMIKADILQQTGLTASVGIAPNKFLAKLASDLEKPDGFVVITEDTKQQILDPLDVSKIWGIGKVTANALYQKGIFTIEQLRNTPRSVLSKIFGNQTDSVINLANGIDSRRVQPHSETKSISAEETFATDIQDKEFLFGILYTQVEEVASRLRSENLQARTITLKIRYGSFKTITRSATLEAPTNTTHLLLDMAKRLFETWYKKGAAPVRLLGFGTSGLSPEKNTQKLLFDDPREQKHKQLDTALDNIRKKYGHDSLKRGH